MAAAARQLTLDGPRNECVFSFDRRYRYLLKRKVAETGGVCLWILANPSVADEVALDPTLTRCVDYTQRWGYGEMRVVNVRAWISTDPKGVPKGDEAFGPDNARTVNSEATTADLVVGGWGRLGGALAAEMHAYLRTLGVIVHALKRNDDGSPSHPLYLAKSLKPFPMETQS